MSTIETRQRQLENDRNTLDLRRAELAQQGAIAGQENAFRRQETAFRREELSLQKDLDRRERKDRETERGVQKLSERVQNTGAADLVEAFKNLRTLIPQEGDVPGFGATAALPDLLVSEKAEDIRQNVATMRNAILKARSGGAVTQGEADRFLQEIGEGYFKSDRHLKRGIKNIEGSLKRVLKNAYAGYDSNVIDEFVARGGVAAGSFEAVPQTQPSASGWSITLTEE